MAIPHSISLHSSAFAMFIRVENPNNVEARFWEIVTVGDEKVCRPLVGYKPREMSHSLVHQRSDNTLVIELATHNCRIDGVYIASD